MNAAEAVRAIVDAAPEALFVSSLGTATSALRAATDDGPHLYMGGSMGSALAAALGVADCRPHRKVVAIVGDGETVMGAGSLWALAGLKPLNVLVAVLVDGHYTITGGQPLGVPSVFADVSAALGGVRTATAASGAGIAEAMGGGPWPALVEVHYEERQWPGPSAFVDCPVVRSRFTAAATGEPAAI